MKFPTVGISLGVGLLVAECVAWIRGVLDSFGGGGIWLALLQSLVLYVVVGAVIDLAVQLVARGRWKTSPILRGLPFVILAVFLHYNFGVAKLLALATVPGAVVWACAVHVRWGAPLAAGMVLFGFSPAFTGAGNDVKRTPLVDSWRDGPSFVVVVLDTVRRDHCSTYGYERDTTPNLTTLAQSGAKFEDAYASSCWSIPSHASLFTGLLPRNHGATFEHFRLEADSRTVASVLAAAGWETVGFSANPYIASGTGMDRGFNRYEDLWRPAVMRRMVVAKQFWARLTGVEQDKGGRSVVDEFRRWLDERDGDRPYFAFVNIMEAHAPYQDAPLRAAFTDPGLSGRRLEKIGDLSHEAQWMGTRVEDEHLPPTVDLLDGATASADRFLGEILEAVGDDAVVVVVSDHGDLIGEHDLHGHMTGLYEPLIRIPMVIAGPGVPEGAEIRGPVSIVDVMPTILTLAGVEKPPTDGIDLAPAMAGEISLQDRLVMAEHYRTDRATQLWAQYRSPEEMRSIQARRAAVVGRGRKRVVAQDGSDLGYDLLTDPLEQRPFLGTDTGHEASVPAPRDLDAGPVDLDPAQIEALRSLGYVH
jgi:arylsulfatase A-like enzyme